MLTLTEDQIAYLLSGAWSDGGFDSAWLRGRRDAAGRNPRGSREEALYLAALRYLVAHGYALQRIDARELSR